MTDSIGFAIDDGVGYLRLSGSLRHDTAGELETLIEQWFGSGGQSVRAVVIDLNRATFMDSTVIGLLANIARELKSHGLPKATVFSTQHEINQLLRSLCLDQALVLVEQATTGDASAAANGIAAAGDLGTQCSAAAILKAHEMLIELNEGNRAAFQPVVDMFRQELAQPR